MHDSADQATCAQVELIFELLEYLVSRVALSKVAAKPIVFELVEAGSQVWSFDPRRKVGRLFQRGRVEGARLKVRAEPALLMRLLLEPDFSIADHELHFVGELECLDHLASALEHGCDLMSEDVAR